MRARLRSEAGFTLIELLISLTALGIIMAPLGGVMYVGYRTMDRTANRLSSSSDAQLLSIYLPPDIKSADTGTTASITCTGVTITNPKLQLTSNAHAAGGGLAAAVSIVYWVKTVTGGFQLVRSVCGAAPTSIVVVRNLYLVTSVTVTAIGTAPIKGFSMAVTEQKSPREPTYYVFTVSGRFRTGIAA